VSILSVDLTVEFRSGNRVLSGVAFDLEPGEIVGVIGRSGSGKSTLAMSLLGLLDHGNTHSSGRIHLDGLDILRMSERRLRDVRGKKIALVLQAAASALNPHLRLADQIREAWQAHASGAWSAARTEFMRTLHRLDLDCDEAFLRRYPGEISVGQAQRVLIAMAVLHKPSVLVADEPTSALDPIAASEVIRLLRRLTEELDMALVYISHDLASVAQLCNRLVILEAGRVVEEGSTASVFSAPRTEYVQKLVAALRQQYPNLPGSRASLQRPSEQVTG
jgi:ABC-type glutathione transport system ATPase component